MPDSCAKSSGNNPRPVFLEGARGSLFAVYHSPQVQTGRGVLFVPPFAEEMNKARRMLALQAGLLVEDGFAVLLLDLYGTGDSEGDFRDAEWATWIDDLGRGAEFLRRQGASELAVLGVRAGGLLALDALGQGALKSSHVVLWNPVLNGRQWLTQFLRLRVAAGMFGGGGETVDGLKGQLKDAGVLEVAGYELNADLGGTLDALNLENAPLPAGLRMTWLELVGADDRPLSLVARRTVDGWRQAGAEIEARTVTGDSFWATQEITVAPALLEATRLALSAIPPNRQAAGDPEPSAESAGAVPVSATREEALVFEVEGTPLVGVLHRPAAPCRRGVLLVVGGPQYRVGSHRQFILLARALALSGTPVLRFDYRGMGDSGGAERGFERVEADIRAAMDTFAATIPEMQEVVLWGLCDAAAACSFYAHKDRRVAGLVILNPWVRTDQGIARAYLTRYYAARLFDADLWRKLFSGRLDIKAAVGSFVNMVLSAVGVTGTSASPPGDYDRDSLFPGGRGETPFSPSPQPSPVKGEGGGREPEMPATAGAAMKQGATSESSGRPLPERVADGLFQFKGRVLLILSGKDLTAEEFRQAVAGSRRWRRLMKSPLLSKRLLEDADHTFSRRGWRDQVANWTREWLQSW